MPPESPVYAVTGRALKWINVAIEFDRAALLTLHSSKCSTRDQVEHWLGIARRGGHRLQDIDGRGLMFDPLAVFAVARVVPRRAWPVPRPARPHVPVPRHARSATQR